MALRVGSVFSGSGAMDLAFEQAGAEIAWQIELDAAAQSVLARHWPETPRYADVTQVDPADLDVVDVLIGGFPCQDLSISGRRRGLAGARSGLFYEWIRLLESLRPRWFLLENVPGLFSSNARRDFAYVLSALDQCGYGVAWRVLDSRYFGVPQRRRRVFIVGYLGTPAGPCQVLFKSDGLSRDLAAGRPTRDSLAAPVGMGAAATSGRGHSRRVDRSAHRIAGTLMASGAGLSRVAGQTHEIDFLVGPDDEAVAWGIRLSQTGANGTPVAQNVSPTITTDGAMAVFSEEACQPCTQPPDDPTWVITKAERIDMDADMTPTLRATSIRNLAVQTPDLVRRFTPREAERLQGLPDDWTRWGADGRELSDEARYRLIGNAITVPVVRWIAERIVQIDAVRDQWPEILNA
ncbi:DNA-cytosine methyltransferase [Sulfobacillus acidophilus DSM 10332]|uniref:Cytosine-specific methyltransferase n=1 Tax=Sulfobacillus acidophilus (strain ATCC 700253 / DSM 10332 / NAL) TaxID=679936 RepID=G8TUM2_SULAD|nr:DNA-cytosine methyltransferase [Sulfobacillus acidophilus DSM 10332]